MTFEDAEIDGGHLELGKVRVEEGGVLNLSHLRIASVPLAQTDSGQDSPLNLDEAEISGGTVNLERIQIATGPDRSKVIWSGGREEGGGQFIASFRQLIVTDGRVSFNRAKIPYGKFSFVCGNFTGGVLDFEYAELNDCCLEFAGAKIDGGCLNFSNGWIGVRRPSDRSPRSGFVYEWLEGLRNMKDVSSRDMVWKKYPHGVVVFLDAELGSGHLKFNGASVRGVLLDFPGLRASGGKITFTGSLFDSSVISLWNANLSGECEIEIQPHPYQDVTVLYSRSYGGLSDRVVLGDQVKLLEVSGAD